MASIRLALLARGLLATAGVLSASSWALSADAQTASPQNSSSAIETIVVTATRTAKDIQKVSVAVTALTEKDIKLQAPQTLLDLNGTAPNVFIGMDTAGPGASAIFIRGLGYADIEKTQTPSVGVVMDGVVFGTSTGQLLDTFDISQVEVERGPQGIFFGQNTTAGVINVTRSAPTREWGGKVSVSYGADDGTVLRGLVNAPLGDNGGIKVGGTFKYNYGDYLNEFTGDHAGGDRYYAFNAATDYDLTSWLNVKANYDRTHELGGGYPVEFGNALTANIIAGAAGLTPKDIWANYNPETGSPDGLGVREVNNNFKDSDKYDNSVYSVILNAETPIGTLVSQTAFMDEADLVHQDFDGTCVGSAGCVSVGNPLIGAELHTIRDQTYKQFTQELRLNGDLWDKTIEYLGGFFLIHHDTALHQNTNAAVDQFSTESGTSYSFFGNADWNVTDTIKLSAGLRSIGEDKHFQTAYFAGATAIVPQINDQHSWDRVITRFGAQWQALDTTMIYATRSEGFRSGGFSIRGTLSEQKAASTNCGQVGGCPANNFLAYKPETNVQYEIGAKNTFYDGSVVLNAAAFIIEDKGFQFGNVVVTPGYGSGTNTYIANLPKVQSKGLEFEADVSPAQWMPTLEGLTLLTTVGIQKATIVDGVIDGRLAAGFTDGEAGVLGSSANFTGQTLQRVPNYNYTIRGNYARKVGEGELQLTAGWSFQDAFSLGSFGTAQDIQPGYGLIDAQVGYEWNNYRISLSGKNLGDKSYRDQSLPTVFFEGYGPGRMWMLQLDAKF